MARMVLIAVLFLTPGCSILAMSISSFMDRVEEQGCKIDKARFNRDREIVDIECK